MKEERKHNKSLHDIVLFIVIVLSQVFCFVSLNIQNAFVGFIGVGLTIIALLMLILRD